MTALRLFRHCRKVGISIAADGAFIAIEAPKDVVIPVDAIQIVKAELLALLRGEYLRAALELALRHNDLEQREALVEWYDERAGICEYQGNLPREEAEQAAYVQLAQLVERLSQPSW